MAFAKPTRVQFTNPKDLPNYTVPATGRNQPYRDGWNVERAVEAGLNRSIAVYRCITAISVNAAKLPMLVREENWVDGKIVDRPEFTKVFNREANEAETSNLFRRRISQIVLLNRQGCFLRTVRSRMGDILAVYILPPGRTYPIPDPDHFVAGYEVWQPNGQRDVIRPEEVKWIREPHPTNPYLGLTPLEAAGLSVEMDYYARLYNRNFMANDGRPGGIMVIRGDLSPEDQQELQRRYTGNVGNAGQVSVVSSEDGADFVDLSTTPRDAAYTEARKDAHQDIFLAFGVPESVAGDASGRTFDNADAELEGFWRETMLPHLDLVSRPLDALLEDENLWISYDFGRVPVLERDLRTRKAFALQEFTARAIAADEYREETGRERVGASKLYDAMNNEIADVDRPYTEVGADAAAPAPGEIGWDPAAAPPVDPWAAFEQGQPPQLSAPPAFGTAVPMGGSSGAADGSAGDLYDSTGWGRTDTGKALGDSHEVIMVAIAPPADVAEEAGWPEDAHVTLAILSPDGWAAARAATAAFATCAGPMQARTGGFGWFNLDDGVALWGSVDCPGLSALRARLVSALTAAGLTVSEEHDFTPHLTIRYLPAGTIPSKSDLPDMPPEGIQWPVDHLIVSSQDGEWSRFPLTGGRVDVKDLREAKRAPLLAAVR